MVKKTAKKAMPKGMHKMESGKMMKNSEMKKKMTKKGY